MKNLCACAVLIMLLFLNFARVMAAEVKPGTTIMLLPSADVNGPLYEMNGIRLKDYQDFQKNGSW